MPKPVDTLLDKIGRWIAARLHAPSSGYEPFTASDPKTLNECLQPGDILLVEGNQKISAAIKYLTQSTWSHAALFVGDKVHEFTPEGERHRLIEVNLGQGCVSVPLSKYENFNTRICRPVGLTKEDRKTVVTYMVDRIGLKYDLKNILDLMRYLLPTPPVPVRWRRRMLALGSGDPTRAICSTLIAQAFQKVRFPILPRVEQVTGKAITRDRRGSHMYYTRSEILHIRHHSLYAPRDFDLSPYFAVVKPTIEKGFDYKRLTWSTTKRASKTKTAGQSDKSTGN
ncbi:MAG: lipo-like protein [Hyphomicrobiales bacterium]|nr:lipo-like protein [Hyphomicrobiales bacterium]PCJ85895.1 MAG: lipo-like protein [Hyphomicrobiales bacterium]